MQTKSSAPYGSWPSPVSVEFVAGKERSLTPNLQVDGDDLYFIEARPDEGGRQVLMRRTPDGKVEAAIPEAFNVRTRYLEYGGTCFLVRQGEIYFVHLSDQQIYKTRMGEQPVQLTHDPLSRFADLSWDEKHGRLLALREVQASPESKNSICSIDLTSGEIQDLVSGRDFYLSPRLNRDSTQLLWISWDHPNMAWNGTELWVAQVGADGAIRSPKKIAGDSSHGVCQPQWSGTNDILFVAELDQWFNLYRYQEGSISAVHPMNAEFAYPDWTPGQKQYATAQRTICASFHSNGAAKLLMVQDGQSRILTSSFASLGCLEAGQDRFFALATFSNQPAAIVQVSLEGEISEVFSSYPLKLSSSCISVAQELQYPTEDQGVGYAWFYAPKNDRFQGPDSEKPPLIVTCHGGPTAMSAGDFKKSVQFWTSRGYAVVDVNYGGSSGYGRNYRERLRQNWGLVDVSDCASAVKHLANRGEIDPNRVAIRGGSAGGYTTLAALTFTQGVFSVGASYFGVSELELLAKETHKLESRYLDQLVGPYPADIAKYKERSPLEHVEKLRCPIVFFQGDEDRVVPPNQSQLMYDSLKSKGIFSEYHLYAGEGHGFRKAETVQHSLKAEHGFYAKVFGFQVSAEDRV